MFEIEIMSWRANLEFSQSYDQTKLYKTNMTCQHVILCVDDKTSETRNGLKLTRHEVSRISSFLFISDWKNHIKHNRHTEQTYAFVQKQWNMFQKDNLKE
jgi:hypothetical protein